MTKTLKQVIDALLAQGYDKAEILATLASEYWVDQSVTKYLRTI